MPFQKIYGFIVRILVFNPPGIAFNLLLIFFLALIFVDSVINIFSSLDNQVSKLVVRKGLPFVH